MSEVRAFEFTGHFPSNVEWAQSTLWKPGGPGS
jgi:hypothetical protein